MSSPEFVSPRQPTTLGRREFVRRLSSTAAGGGLVAAAFAGCHLSPSQQAEASEAVVDKLGKLPKVQLGRRMGNMQVSRVVMSQDWPQELYGPGLAAGIN